MVKGQNFIKIGKKLRISYIFEFWVILVVKISAKKWQILES